MTPQDPRADLRDAALVEATEQFVKSLKALGVESYLVGYAKTENPEGEGAFKFEGSAALILNLVAGILKGMRPEDFKTLLGVMMFGDYFASHRGKMKIGPAPVEDKKGFVN